MKVFKVTWEIEVLAKNHKGAARICREIQLNPGSTATVFKVMGRGSKEKKEIDLSKEKGELK